MKIYELTYSIDPLIKETAEALNLPIDVVHKVIMFEGHIINENYKTWKYVGFRLEDLGSLYLKPHLFNKAMRTMINKARRFPDGSYKKLLANAWKLRHQVYEYRKSRKFRERFGSWHT